MKNRKLNNSNKINVNSKNKELKLIHTFAATVNHEINNPLTSIIGSAEISEIAYENGMEDTLRKALQNIIKEAEKIRNITKKLENLKSLETIDYAGYANIIDIS